MNVALFVVIVIAMTVGVFNLIYKNLLKDYQALDLSDKAWEEE